MSDRFDVLCREAQLSGEDFIVEMLRRILLEADREQASDVHFQPGKLGVEVRFRLQGVLHLFGVLPPEHTAQISARLKVLAHLLTYKNDVPQEGRVRSGSVAGITKEMRLSTVATLYGERVVVRFFSEENCYQYPEELGFPPEILETLLGAVRKNAGMILLTGPAGSGKTTTAYAILRELLDRSETLRSIVSLEDPIEHAIERIAQIEVNERCPLSLDEMLKYTMRQDPEVLFVGEIRDKKTAEVSMQAALSGHLLLTTFHAGSATEAIGRLCEIGIEPFVLRSSVSYVLSQRLLRKLCPECKVECKVKATPESVPSRDITIGTERFELDSWNEARGCEKCHHSGYSGRVLLAEALPLENGAIVRGVLERTETAVIRELALASGMVPLAQRAHELIQRGITSPLEVKRVFG